MEGVTYFLIVAVEKYHSSDFTQVSYAQNDGNGIAEAYKELGYDTTNMTLLLNDKATRSSIFHALEVMSERTREEDRIVIYFAGHGANDAGMNYILPVDAQIDRLPKTGISMESMLGILNESISSRKILFFDCCHSGFTAGNNVRDTTSAFKGDDLEYAFRTAEYCVGFASCKSSQKSLSHKALSHGVWSHFLIQSLKGEAASGVYQDGYLMAGSLQKYLHDNTYEYLQKFTTEKKVQTPMQFGITTGDFIVENINPIFDHRAAKKIAESLSLESICLLRVVEGAIKNLKGFEKKKGHFIPDRVGSNQDQFVKSISGDIVKNEITEISLAIKSKLKYTRKQLKSDFKDGYGWIETPDFLYTVEVRQSNDDSTMYEIVRQIDNMEDDSMINNPLFNEIFDNWFTSLRFEFDKHIDVGEWIDTFEERGLEVKYNPVSPETCTLSLPGLDTDIIISVDSEDIFFTYPASPIELVTAYKKTAIYLETSDIKLLS
ncbi:caspase family protein [Flavitalea sp. BT771]|uniref:caspase family protein n=1 Tax=Flavitalea sp. BT771 TaxID=3063329 RepID=UPI0029490538|nr:caspase family protein [Flavitalea sp. BT771]MDV6217849.1 caspase family protein [Flavitalea sp. BT771]